MTAEPVSEEPVSEELGEIELFGSLNDGSDDCVAVADPSRYEVLPFRYIVMLRDTADETRRAVLDVAHFGTVYKTLPLMEVQGSAELVATLGSMPEVFQVVPAIRPLDSTRTVAVGLDFLATLAVAQATAAPAPLVGPHGDDSDGYPVVREFNGGWIVEGDETVDWPVPPPIMPVINMSLGTKVIDYPFLRNDVVNLATAAASGEILLVMAAGNCGDRPGESMSAWAEPDWVLSVGATEDEDGTRLAGYSSRGHAADPATGPDLVAYGRSAVPPHPEGTSFAAPRVTVCAMVAAAAILQLERIDRSRQGIFVGIPLVGLGFIDSFPGGIWEVARPKREIGALPVVGVDVGAVTEILDLAAGAGIRVSVHGDPAILRSLLLDATTPMAGYAGHEVGRGFIDRRRLLDHLGAATGEDLVRWFGDVEPGTELDTGLAEALRGLRLFERTGLEWLADIVIASCPEWRYDWKRSRAGWVPVGADELAALSEDQRLRGIRLSWPPPFSG